MEFNPDKTGEFIKIFNESKPFIERSEGCIKVELFRDSELENVFYTHSLWENEKFLNKYRKIDFFTETWNKTKKLFSGKPKAFSLVDPDL
jgi:quinol monooxygenase YgiN